MELFCPYCGEYFRLKDPFAYLGTEFVVPCCKKRAMLEFEPNNEEGGSFLVLKDPDEERKK